MDGIGLSTGFYILLGSSLYYPTFGFYEPAPPAGGLRQTQLHLSVPKTRYGRPANSLRYTVRGAAPSLRLRDTKIRC